MKCIHFFVISITQITWGAVPGTFFWKPRLGLDFTPPPMVSPVTDKHPFPTINLIREGEVVLINGYTAGLSFIALVDAFTMRNLPHTHPMSAYYYTNLYRWVLRHLDLTSLWMEGNNGNYCHTHQVWNRRFFYLDKFVPPWLQKLFFFVDGKEWKEEESFYKNKYIKHSGHVFGKHYANT